MTKKLFPLMLHHFHDNKKHFKTQGSFSKDQFYKLLKKIGIKNILSPNNFLEKIKNGKLKNNQTCITFDDGIKSQFDIAYPLIKDLNLKAFFFIYSSIFDKKINFLELNRYFREIYYKNVDEYYIEFYKILERKYSILKINKIIKNNQKKITNLKKIYKFYSLSDLKFRFIRDNIIDKKNFNQINLALFKKKNFDYKMMNEKIYINKNDLKVLSKDNNTIGLHSHSHPTNFNKLSFNDQFRELKMNKIILEKIINKKIFSLAYPLGKYNKNTLRILKKLKIELAFLSNPFYKEKSNLMIPREDHTLMFKRL